MRIGPSGASTASRCAGLRSSRFNEGIAIRCGNAGTTTRYQADETIRYKARYRLRAAAKSRKAKSCAKLFFFCAVGGRLMARYEPRDKFYRKAREQGLPSRAAFKLEELIARFKIARAGARVADLGCAPGGWLAILARAVGADGRVVGIDLVQCRAP